MHVSDLSFLYFGRTGIYVANICIGVGIFALSCLFYIFFAQTFLSLFVIGDEFYETAKIVTIIGITLLMTPVTLKRQISELKLQRYFMPIGSTCIILALASQLMMTTETQTKELKRAEFNDLIHAFNIVITAYGFLINLYPIYDKIEPNQRNHKTILLACTIGLLFCALIYLAFSKMSIEVFGLENLKTNILTNMDNGSMLFLITKVLFLIIFICAIPFSNIVPKRCILNIYEETVNATISTNLSQN